MGKVYLSCIRTAIFAVLFMAFATAKAGDGNGVERRFAVSARFNVIRPTASTTGGDAAMGDAAQWTGPNGALHLEYYIPQTHFSIIGGFESEELSFCGDDVLTDAKLLTFGGRYYPCPRSWFVQPHVGASTYWNITGRHSDSKMAAFGYIDYTRDYTTRQPLFSFAPVVGVDLYVFTCIAVTLDYGFRVALNGNTKVVSNFPDQNITTTTHSRMHRHAVSLGLKVSFPFKFTTADGAGLIESVIHSLASNKQKSVNRPLIYY